MNCQFGNVLKLFAVCAWLACLAALGAQAQTAPAYTIYTIVDLGTLGGTKSYAYGINDSGQMTGERFMPNSPTKGFFFNGTATTEIVDTKCGYGINNTGNIVGVSSRLIGRSTGPRNSVIVNCGFTYSASTLSKGENYTRYCAVNTMGTIAGQRRSNAALWRNGVQTVLGPLNSMAYALNDHDQAVGVWDFKAVLFTGGQALAINDLLPPNSGWNLFEARGINNRGWIVGTGIHNGQTRAFLLFRSNITPISAVRDFNGDGMPDLLTDTDGRPTYGYIR